MNTNTVNPEVLIAEFRDDAGPPFGPGPQRPVLRRAIQDRMVAGVAAGLAGYLGVDVMIVRVAFVVLTVFSGAGIPLYLAGLLLIPEKAASSPSPASPHRVPAVPATAADRRRAVNGVKGTACQRKRTSPATAVASSHGSAHRRWPRWSSWPSSGSG